MTKPLPMDTKIFDKANSILAISQRPLDGQDTLSRVAQIRNDIGTASDYKSSVIRRACQDLLDPMGNSAEGFKLKDYVAEEIRRLPDAGLPRYLFYRYRYDMYPQQKIVDDFPPCLQIEPASICNYRCVFCYQTDKSFTNPANGHMGIMKTELFKQIIDQAAGHCEAVTLASRGEPLICPNIHEMLRYAAGKFLALKINTNAWFLDEQMCHSMLQADVNTLVFSADAAAEPLYSQLRVNGRLDRILRNVRMFQNIRTRDYPRARILTRVSGVRYGAGQSMQEMQAVWGELVDQVAFVDYNPWENTYERPLNDLSTPCSDLWRRMFVWYDGRVNPCDVDYKSTLLAGDFKDQILSSIWTGERYSEIRARHLAAQRGAVSPCNRCTVI